MDYTPPRPEGFDYEKPDPAPNRCTLCNRDGMNRTGLQAIGLVGVGTMTHHARPCPEGCDKGLVH